MDQRKKNPANPFEHPNPHSGGGNKEQGKAGTSTNLKCFRSGEAGHRSYECPTKKVEVHLVEEHEEGREPIYDESPEGDAEVEYCEPEGDAES